MSGDTFEALLEAYTERGHLLLALEKERDELKAKVERLTKENKDLILSQDVFKSEIMDYSRGVIHGTKAGMEIAARAENEMSGMKRFVEELEETRAENEKLKQEVQFLRRGIEVYRVEHHSPEEDCFCDVCEWEREGAKRDEG